MKTTKKFFTYGLLIFTMVFTSCSKDGEIGPIGPSGSQGVAGQDGVNGTDGTNGTDGIDGNANVMIFEYGSRTFTSTTSYLMEGVSNSDIDNNLILAFYGKSFTEIDSNGGILNKIQWRPVPGRGENNLFETNSLIETTQLANNANLIVGLYNFDGTPFTTQRTFSKFKIFMAPSSLTGKSGKANLSKMSYEEVVTYLDQSE